MLHPDTSSRNKVLDAIRNAADAFAQNNPTVQEKLASAYPDPVAREQARQQIVSKLNAGFVGASQERTDPKWFLPRNALAAVAQSAMNLCAQNGPPRAVRAATSQQASVHGFGTPGRVGEDLVLAAAPLEQYGPADPGWIECVVDGFKALFEGKAPFVQHQTMTDFLYPINDRATIALVADWGADNDVARRVAAQIKANNPDIVIHLGDIYYAGQDNEVEAALAMWPMKDPATGTIPEGTSFALNGNHEMFCGGRAYFSSVFRAFGQEASYFGLRNANWQILAFDSAYIEHRLLSPEDALPIDARLSSQWLWLVDKMRNSALPTILLSHHEPISAFGHEHSDGQNLREDFQKFVTASGRHVFGWFFGHEHRCTFYDGTIVPFARLIGNGCIPHAAPPTTQQPDPGCEAFSKMNFRTNANGDAVSGFAVLRFDGPDIDIRYIDEDGFQFAEEVWVAPPIA